MIITAGLKTGAVYRDYILSGGREKAKDPLKSQLGRARGNLGPRCILESSFHRIFCLCHVSRRPRLKIILSYNVAMYAITSHCFLFFFFSLFPAVPCQPASGGSCCAGARPSFLVVPLVGRIYIYMKW